MSALLDVNALIALVDSDHLGHQAMQKWFLTHHRSGWATCPITENGMIRVLSQPAYPSGQRTPAEGIQVLTALKKQFDDSYEFWTDDRSLCDNSLFKVAVIAGSRQVTDVYLLGLAVYHAGVIVTLDRSLGWHAVRSGSEKLIRRPS